MRAKKNPILSLTALVILALVPTVHSQTFVRKPFLQKGGPDKASVCWRISSAASLTVKFGTTAAALDKSSAPSANATDACVALDNLQPNTKYFYEIYAGATKLTGVADQSFLTHPPVGERGSYNYWIIGDAGTGYVDQTDGRDIFVKLNKGPRTDAFIMLGDNAYDAGTDLELTNKLFKIYPDILATSFTWPTIGNHEKVTSNGLPHLAAFYLPTGGESGGVASKSELYYSFDHGNVHFICLDSEVSSHSKTGPQYLWLQQDLEATKQDWIVAYYHTPPYTWGSHNSDTEVNHGDMRATFDPLLEQYGVDMVFSGHSHDYERSFLIDSAYGTSADNKAKAAKVIKDNKSGNPATSGPYRKASMKGGHQGTVYTVAGSSGHVSAIIGLHPVMYVQYKIAGSVMLNVNDTVATAKFIDNEGTVKDQYQIVKVRPISSVAKESAKPASKFMQTGRNFWFAKDNEVPFRVYSLNGDLLVTEAPRGDWTPAPETLPAGTYYFRFGSFYGKVSLP